MINEDIKAKYVEVGGLLEDALKKAKSIDLVGEEENAELNAINSTLESINENFKKEIEKLEASSEWDKFCIAFFGETNAGKSTIIESLRIIYNEEKRRLELEKQEKEYGILLSKHSQDYQGLLMSLEEVNNALYNKKGNSLVVKSLRYIGVSALGIVIGYLISHFGLF